MNYTVKHFEIFQMIAQRPKSKTIEYRILKLFCQTSCEYVLSIRRLWSSRSVKFTAVIEKLVRRYHVQSPKIDLTDTLESWLRNHESWFMTKIFELVVRKTLINLFAGEFFLSVSQIKIWGIKYRHSHPPNVPFCSDVSFFRIKTLIFPIPLDFMLIQQLKGLTVKVGFKGVTVCCKSEYLFTC